MFVEVTVLAAVVTIRFFAQGAGDGKAIKRCKCSHNCSLQMSPHAWMLDIKRLRRPICISKKCRGSDELREGNTEILELQELFKLLRTLFSQWLLVGYCNLKSLRD